ncbi:MAG TPA: hypothetical protein VG448_09425 [Solirubrobacterales bacterium]|nr:hypothetical protein [Solirubrobacterales bacterium]
MKLKGLTCAVMALAILLALASSASATTLEVKGLKQTGAVTLKASLKAGTSMRLADTSGEFTINTCTVSTIEGASTIFTGTTVTIPVNALTFQTCTEEPITIDTRGSLTIENIAGTTKGTVRWTGLKWTWPSNFGVVSCTTAASPGTDIGTLTGVAAGQATLEINTVINCTGMFTSMKWTATYTVTTPEGLGVTA